MAGLGFAMALIFPIVYGIIGFIGGAAGAFLYNLAAGWIGGIELDLAEKSEQASGNVPTPAATTPAPTEQAKPAEEKPA